MFSLSAIPAVIQGIGMFLLPPSPRYLMLKKREEQVLLKLTLCLTCDISRLIVKLPILLTVCHPSSNTGYRDVPSAAQPKIPHAVEKRGTGTV